MHVISSKLQFIFIHKNIKFISLFIPNIFVTFIETHLPENSLQKNEINTDKKEKKAHIGNLKFLWGGIVDIIFTHNHQYTVVSKAR